jgi:hypothetical protein
MSNSEQQQEFQIYCRHCQQWFCSQGGYTYHFRLIHDIRHWGHSPLEAEDILSSEEDLGPSEHLQHEAEWPPELLSGSLSSKTNTANADPNSGLEGLLLGTGELVDETMAFDVNIEASDEGHLGQQLPLAPELPGSDSGKEENTIPQGHFIKYHPTINGTWFFIRCDIKAVS